MSEHPKESLEQSLKEMHMIREGKLPKKSWKELCDELKEEEQNDTDIRGQ